MRDVLYSCTTPVPSKLYEAVWVCMQLPGLTDVVVFYCRFARPHQLFFSGVVKGESAMTSLEDIGSPVDFEFVVRNECVCVCLCVCLC